MPRVRLSRAERGAVSRSELLMTRFFMVCTFAIALVVPVLAGQDEGGEEHPKRSTVVAYGKRLDVKQLDPALERERLDHFLKRVLPKGTKLTWMSSDCENKPATFPRPPDTPLCVSVTAGAFGGGLRLHVVVGTHSSPIQGAPKLEKLYILRPPPTRPGDKSVEWFPSLSAFAKYAAAN